LTRDFLDSKAGGENLFGVYRNYFDSTKSGDLINKLLYVDLKTYMPECLRMFDVMGKSSLMEVRSPFLDHELVEFLFKVPSIFKLKGFTSKYLLKKAMAKNFSHGVFSKAKRGLSSPVNVWIKHGWKDMVTDILSAEKTKSLNYFNQKYIEQILNEHFGNIKNNSWKILSLLVFYLWHDIYINAPAGKNC
jgi:asparagine synthase (glutamine-hydrolysing)